MKACASTGFKSLQSKNGEITTPEHPLGLLLLLQGTPGGWGVPGLDQGDTSYKAQSTP